MDVPKDEKEELPRRNPDTGETWKLSEKPKNGENNLSISMCLSRICAQTPLSHRTEETLSTKKCDEMRMHKISRTVFIALMRLRAFITAIQ